MRVLFAALTLSLVAAPALAHGQRSALLRVRQLSPGHALAEWSIPSADAPVRPIFPERCAVQELSNEPTSKTFALDCPAPLAGSEVGVSGLGAWISDATILVELGDRTASTVLHRDEPRWVIPTEEGALETAASYVRRGFSHILSGADHLLFLTLLAIGLRRPRAVLLAETAFTASHSLSFSLTALGWIHVPAAPAEACIALSLVLLALDIDPTKGEVPLRPAVIGAFVFGLVHGLGFAGGLSELGVPDRHAALALVGFGAGVELGQVLFLALLLGAFALLFRGAATPLRFRRFATVSATLSGGAATYWLGERLLACFLGGSI